MKVEMTVAIEADLFKQVKMVASDVFEKALWKYPPKLEQKTEKRKLIREEEEI